jgi:hypothetical protein
MSVYNISYRIIKEPNIDKTIAFGDISFDNDRPFRTTQDVDSAKEMIKEEILKGYTNKELKVRIDSFTKLN